MLKNLYFIEFVRTYFSVTGYGFYILRNYSNFENQINIFLIENNELHVFYKVKLFLIVLLLSIIFLILGYC